MGEVVVGLCGAGRVPERVPGRSEESAMRFDTSQHMRMGQQMKLAPRMIQSMEILQMPLTELQERIEQELENNPTLELAEPGDGTAEGTTAEAAMAAAEAALEGVQADVPSMRDEDVLTIDADGGATEFQRLDSFEETNPDAIENEYSKSDHATAYESTDYGDEGSFVRRDGERDAKMDAMASTPARGEPLQEQLQMQWLLAEVDPALKPMGRAIIAALDDDGYLRTALEQVARDFVLRGGVDAGDAANDEDGATAAVIGDAGKVRDVGVTGPSAEAGAPVNPDVMEGVRASAAGGAVVPGARGRRGADAGRVPAAAARRDDGRGPDDGLAARDL
jgi:hypothetical protein